MSYHFRPAQAGQALVADLRTTGCGIEGDVANAQGARSGILRSGSTLKELSSAQAMFNLAAKG